MFLFYLTSSRPYITTLDIPHGDCYQTWPMPSPGVCLFSKISILILCVDVKISGQPQSSLDNINSGGLFWSSVITSGHWEREIQAATQYNIYTAICYQQTISTSAITSHTQYIDQHRTDIKISLIGWRPMHDLFHILYIIYYTVV